MRRPAQRAPTPADVVAAPTVPTAWHVAVVVENVPLGVDTRLRKQVEDLLGAGFTVSVVTMRHDSNAPYRARPGIRVLEYAAPPDGTGVLGYAREYGVAFARASARLLALRARGRIDVLQLCQPPDVYFPVAWVLRLLGARVVVDQRDLMPEVLASRSGRPSRALTLVLHALERETRRVAHHTVTVNDYLRERLAGARGGPSTITVARNGPVLRRVDRAQPDPALREEGTSLVVWAGKIGRQDRVDLVVRLADEIVHRRARHDVRFVVLGDGECEQELRDLVGSLGLGAAVHFTGWVDETTVFRHLASADLGVDTSLQDEVTPVKAMEYFAFGLPLACFDLQESRRLGSGAGVFVPPGDVGALATAVLDLLDDSQRRRDLGRAGRRMVEERLCWERQATSYLAAVSPPVSPPVSSPVSLPVSPPV